MGELNPTHISSLTPRDWLAYLCRVGTREEGQVARGAAARSPDKTGRLGDAPRRGSGLEASVPRPAPLELWFHHCLL